MLSAALADMIALERTVRKVPAALITIGFGIGVSLILGLEQYGVPVVS
ncbi:hypothetical protein [Synechococcus sp. CS-1331]|nr:hypothetical protein [Synechococcus sp. CS-1331]